MGIKLVADRNFSLVSHLVFSAAHAPLNCSAERKCLRVLVYVQLCSQNQKDLNTFLNFN